MSYTRFAIYYLPPDGALADFGAAWLGWDVRDGTSGRTMTVQGLDDVTMTPRKYGFHGTLKPPFRLADGTTQAQLAEAIAAMTAGMAPAQCDGLQLENIGRFLALTPGGDTAGITRVAQGCVASLDRFRAPATDHDLTRRRAAGLTLRQDENLLRWGYPYVFDDFNFHLTLTGKLEREDIAHWKDIAAAHLPRVPSPFVLDAVALVGERADGRFELIQRYPLTG